MTGYWVVFCLLACGELLIRVNAEVATVACDGVVCQNGASTCNNDGICECLEGWTGDACSDVFGCTEDLVQICNKLSLPCIYDSKVKNAICKCTGENEIFDGINCADPCFSNLCKNDGVCTVINSTDYLCECKQPFSGNHCERHPCHSNPCLNDGTCIAVENNYGCVCDEPFYGRHCENDPCTPSPCKNAGLCEVVGIDFNCTCKAPYYGKLCEIEIDSTEADTTISDLITTGLVTTNKTELNTTDSEYTITDHFSGEITTNIYECYCGENSVSCSIDWRGKKLCFCKDGFDQRRGTEICSRTCQSNADCRNDGICDREGSGNFCLCPGPFIGDRCEVDVCNSVRSECRSKGAECVRQGTFGVCECPRGKMMSLYNYCEDICTYETCIYGTCELTGYNFTQYVCNCYEGYYGRHCEYVMDMHIPALRVLVILASGIVLFSITSIAAGCWVKKLRKKIAENTKQTGQP